MGFLQIINNTSMDYKVCLYVRGHWGQEGAWEAGGVGGGWVKEFSPFQRVIQKHSKPGDI